MNLEEAKKVILNILQSQGKVKNSDMVQALGGDAALFDLVKEDLIFNDLAEDKKNVGLIFTGPGAPPGGQERRPDRLSAEANPGFPVLPDKPERPAPRRPSLLDDNPAGGGSRSASSNREKAQADFPPRPGSNRPSVGPDPSRKEAAPRESLRKDGFPMRPGQGDNEEPARPARELPSKSVRELPSRQARELPSRPGRELASKNRETPTRPAREMQTRPGREPAIKPDTPLQWDPFKASYTDDKGTPVREGDLPWNPQPEEEYSEPGDRPSVHLCFAKQEKQVHSLAGRLERDISMRGFRVWAERQDLYPGDVLIPIITSSSWEYDGNDFWDRIHEAQCMGIRILPILVADGFMNLNMFNLGWVDFSAWNDSNAYTAALGTLFFVMQQGSLAGIESPYVSIFSVLNPFFFTAEAACLIRPFISREWVLREFNKWMGESNSRVFCITGGKGSGKSAILAFLACRYPNAGTYHICKKSWPDTLQPQRIICSLAAQLATRFPNYRSALEAQSLYRQLSNAASPDRELDFSLAEMDPERLFRTLIGEPLRFEQPKSPILFIFDDLDESVSNAGDQQTLLEIFQNGLKDIPSWVRLVFSVSKGSETWENFHGYDPEIIDLSMPENYQDAQTLISTRFSNYPLNDLLSQKDVDEIRLTNTILKKTGGNFIHTIEILDALENDWLDPAHPEMIPDTVFPLFQGYFDHTIEKSEYDFLRSIIEILFAARIPLQSKQIAYYLDGNAAEVESALAKISAVIPCWNGAYFCRHALLYEWLTGQAGHTHYYRINLSLGHRRIAEKLLINHNAGKRDSYLLENLISHLIGAQNYSEIFRTISSYAYIQTCIASGRYVQLMNEYPLVIQTLEKQVDDTTSGKIQWLKLVQSTLQLSIRDIFQDKTQLSGQIIGRLSAIEGFEPINRYITPFLNEIRNRRDAAAWIYPLKPNMVPPGGALLRILNGHAGKITAVILSPEGKRVFSASEDCTVRGWDLERGTALFQFNSHTKKVNAIAITSDGTRLVSASHDKLLKVWDLQNGKELGTLQGHTSYVNAVVITPEGNQAVSASSDNTLKVWNISSSFTSTGNVEAWREIKTLKGHTDSVDKVILTPEGRRAISASADKTIRVWDLENGEVIHVLRGHQSIITILSVLPDGRRFVSSSIEDHSLKVWDLVSGRLLYSLRGHTNFISGFNSTPDGRFAVTSSGDRTLKIWLLPPMMMNGQETGAVEIHTLKGHSSYVRAVVLVPEKDRVISGSADKTIKIWDMQSGQVIRTLTGHTEGINTILLNTSSTRLVSASIDNTIRVWDISAGLEIGLEDSIQPVLAPGHTDTVNTLCVAPDGWRAISASSDGSVKVWNFAASFQGGGVPLYAPGADDQIGRQVSIFEGHKAAVLCSVLTPDGRKVVSAGMGIKVWALESSTEILSIDHPDWIYAVSVTLDGKWIIAGSNEHTLKVWDIESGRYLGTFGDFRERASWVRALALSPDGKRVFSASIDKTIKIWDLRSGNEIGLLRGHLDKVTALALTPDGRGILSGSEDGTIKIWNGETFREAGTLREHRAPVRAISISQDGRRLVSVSDDKSVKVWNLATGQVIASYLADGKMTACAVSKDGTIILAGGYTGRVHFLRLVENPSLNR